MHRGLIVAQQLANCYSLSEHALPIPAYGAAWRKTGVYVELKKEIGREREKGQCFIIASECLALSACVPSNSTATDRSLFPVIN